jgi:hypothetical protein
MLAQTKEKTSASTEANKTKTTSIIPYSGANCQICGNKLLFDENDYDFCLFCGWKESLSDYEEIEEWESYYHDMDEETLYRDLELNLSMFLQRRDHFNSDLAIAIKKEIARQKKETGIQKVLNDFRKTV